MAWRQSWMAELMARERAMRSCRPLDGSDKMRERMKSR